MRGKGRHPDGGSGIGRGMGRLFLLASWNDMGVYRSATTRIYKDNQRK